MRHIPAVSEYPPFFGGYVSLVPEADVAPVLRGQPAELRGLAGTVAPERETFRYAPGKWSIREVVGHMVDAERVFGFRLFCFSRGEQQPLPGFDENAYVAQAGFDVRTLAELVDEFCAVRAVNLVVVDRLDEQAWDRVGTAHSGAVTVRALAYVMAGHVRHHLNGLRSRYGCD